MPNLYRRGRIWWGRVQAQGKDLRRSLRTDDKAVARKRLASWLDEVEHALYHGEHRYTWEEAVGRYITEVMPGAVKSAVATRYMCSLRQIAPVLEGLYADQITRRTVADVVSYRKRSKASNATINRDLTAMSRVLSAAVAWGWRDDNPARDYDRSTTRERRDPITLPPDHHIAEMKARSPDMLARLIDVLRFTGLREEEAASLEWHQVEKSRIILTRTKTSRPRVIPLDDPRIAPVAGTFAGTPRHIKSAAVFWHDDGQRYTTVSSRFGVLRRQANKDRANAGQPPITFRLHDLRHLFAVSYLRDGGNIYDLQKIMGHSSIRTTEIYLDYLTPDEQHEAKAGTKAGT